MGCGGCEAKQPRMKIYSDVGPLLFDEVLTRKPAAFDELYVFETEAGVITGALASPIFGATSPGGHDFDGRRVTGYAHPIAGACGGNPCAQVTSCAFTTHVVALFRLDGILLDPGTTRDEAEALPPDSVTLGDHGVGALSSSQAATDASGEVLWVDATYITDEVRVEPGCGLTTNYEISGDTIVYPDGWTPYAFAADTDLAIVFEFECEPCSTTSSTKDPIGPAETNERPIVVPRNLGDAQQ